jgi:pantothenate kinase
LFTSQFVGLSFQKSVNRRIHPLVTQLQLFFTLQQQKTGQMKEFRQLNGDNGSCKCRPETALQKILEEDGTVAECVRKTWTSFF